MVKLYVYLSQILSIPTFTHLPRMIWAAHEAGKRSIPQSCKK